MIYYAVKLMYRICETMLVYVCSAVGIEGTKAAGKSRRRTKRAHYEPIT